MDKTVLLAQLRALRAHVDALMIAVQGGELPESADDAQGDVVACPKCGEQRDEKLIDTSDDVFGGGRIDRTTCLTCGTSWGAIVAPQEEQSNG